jgi:hypothetical protein
VNDQSNKVPKNKSREKATQEQRLRAALRENLKRRRAQAKARAAREGHHGASHDSAGIAQDKEDEG